MSAFYHIAQNDTPNLNSLDWTAVFRHFVEVCLIKSPNERPSPGKGLSDQFTTRTRSPRVLADLMQRIKAAVRELDNLNYREMKILMIDSCETESTVSLLFIYSIKELHILATAKTTIMLKNFVLYKLKLIEQPLYIYLKCDILSISFQNLDEKFETVKKLQPYFSTCLCHFLFEKKRILKVDT